MADGKRQKRIRRVVGSEAGEEPELRLSESEENPEAVLLDLLQQPQLEQFEVVLPHGHVVICNGDKEYDFCRKNAKPYMEAAEDIPEDYGTSIYMQMVNYLNWFRLQTCLTNPEFTKKLTPKTLKELYTQLNKLQATIQASALKLDPLKLKKRQDGVSTAEFLAMQREEAIEYAKKHIGEYTWLCGTCGAANIQEVPHFAFDSAMGTKAIWNQEIFEMVRKHYDPSDPEIRGKYESSLSVTDAAAILRVSAIAILAIAHERDFYLGFEYLLDKPETFRQYV